MPLYLLDGKLLTNNGRLAISQQCCCNCGLILPETYRVTHRWYCYVDGEFVPEDVEIDCEWIGIENDYRKWRSDKITMPCQPTRKIYYEIWMSLSCGPPITYDFIVSVWDGDYYYTIDEYRSATNPSLIQFLATSVWLDVLSVQAGGIGFDAGFDAGFGG